MYGGIEDLGKEDGTNEGDGGAGGRGEEIRCELCFSVEMNHFSFLDF